MHVFEKKKKSQFNNLNSHLKKLGKKETQSKQKERLNKEQKLGDQKKEKQWRKSEARSELFETNQ